MGRHNTNLAEGSAEETKKASGARLLGLIMALIAAAAFGITFYYSLLPLLGAGFIAIAMSLGIGIVCGGFAYYAEEGLAIQEEIAKQAAKFKATNWKTYLKTHKGFILAVGAAVLAAGSVFIPVLGIGGLLAGIGLTTAFGQVILAASVGFSAMFLVSKILSNITTAVKRCFFPEKLSKAEKEPFLWQVFLPKYAARAIAAMAFLGVFALAVNPLMMFIGSSALALTLSATIAFVVGAGFLAKAGNAVVEYFTIKGEVLDNLTRDDLKAYRGDALRFVGLLAVSLVVGGGAIGVAAATGFAAISMPALFVIAAGVTLVGAKVVQQKLSSMFQEKTVSDIPEKESEIKGSHSQMADVLTPKLWETVAVTPRVEETKTPAQILSMHRAKVMQLPVVSKTLRDFSALTSGPGQNPKGPGALSRGPVCA